MAQLRITLLRSLNSAKKKQVLTAEALGLRGIRQQVVHQDNAAVRGMINVISHMVAVETLEGDNE